MPDHIKVVNITPIMQSGEANQDSEPNVAVNPVNPQEIAATAFTPSPNVNAVNSPVYYSNDGGNTWALLDIIGGTPVRDQTLRFSSTSGTLYAGVLWGNGNLAAINFDILRTNDFSAANVMTQLVKSRKNDDQPFVRQVVQGAILRQIWCVELEAVEGDAISEPLEVPRPLGQARLAQARQGPRSPQISRVPPAADGEAQQRALRRP